MQIVNGMVVRSKKGHDKGKFFVVVSVENNIAYLADYRGRTPDFPKKKNLIHIAPTKTVLDSESVGSDDEIRKILAGFNGRAALPKEVL